MGIISVLCFISIKDIIIYEHEGQLSAHLMIDGYGYNALARGKPFTSCLLYQHGG
jgi:hypothetical protein